MFLWIHYAYDDAGSYRARIFYFYNNLGGVTLLAENNIKSMTTFVQERFVLLVQIVNKSVLNRFVKHYKWQQK